MRTVAAGKLENLLSENGKEEEACPGGSFPDRIELEEIARASVNIR